MDKEKAKILENRKGFIAALDQSGGSSGKTLALYGIDKNRYENDSEMFDLIHEMRKRIMTSKSFQSKKIIGVILFEETMNRKIEDELTADYLWNQKQIISFLKIDKGLEEIKDGVQIMKPIPNFVETLKKAKEHHIFGTKMRSVIYEKNAEGIKEVVEQQFVLAKTIWKNGLVPIIEPEVNIGSPNKKECELLLKTEILKQLELLDEDMKVIFKFTIPTEEDFYQVFTEHKNVLKVVALSGGYERVDACNRLAKNKNMIASFSRALLEGLQESQTQEEFDKTLANSIDMIYNASVNKD